MPGDLVLESLRTAVLFVIIVFLWKEGKNRAEISKNGWQLIIFGFLLLFFGSAIDITDNFDSLNKYILVGDTPTQAFLEKMVGFLGGFILLALGLVRWVPTIVGIEKLQNTMGDLERMNKERNLLIEMTELLQISSNIEETFPIIRRYAGQIFPETSGAVCLIDQIDGNLSSTYEWGNIQVCHVETPAESCWAVRRGKVHFTYDSRTDMVCPHLGKSFTGWHICAPINAQGKPLGILTIQDTSPDSSQSQEGHLTRFKNRSNLARAIADQLGLTIANLNLQESLRNQAIRDPLTGVYNRRFMEETLLKEVRRAERNSSSFGVIMLDIDHFKQLNDNFGHHAGDAVLKNLGGFLKDHFRLEDVVCRYGGDEFTIILPGSSADETQKRADGLRAKIKELEITSGDGQSNQIAVCVGAAAFPDDGKTGEQLLRKADEALLQAKAESRDGV